MPVYAKSAKKERCQHCKGITRIARILTPKLFTPSLVLSIVLIVAMVAVRILLI